MPADETRIDNLKFYWQLFFKAETGTYEKSTWLNLFLAEFLLLLEDGGQPKELITFCPISAVVTLVGCELLCGIHRVTSSIQTHYSGPADTTNIVQRSTQVEEKPVQNVGPFASSCQPSSSEILRKYILGIAWKSLVLLRVLGVEGSSCCRQLSTILIWLFEELSSNDASRNQPPNPHVPQYSNREPIHLLLSNKIWSKQAFSSVQLKSNLTTPERSSNSNRSKRAGSSKTDSHIRKRVEKDTAHSSESNSSNDDLQVFNRSLPMKVVRKNDDFEYFNSPIKSGEEYENALLYPSAFVPEKPKPKADNYMSDRHRGIINSEITSFEFTLIMTDLLQELCKAESSLSGSEGSIISVQCINFSLRNLCALQFGSSPVCSIQYSAQEVARVKVALTELLLVSLDKVLLRSDLCAKLINSGILPMLLRILEDLSYKLKYRFNTKDNHDRNNAHNAPEEIEESENILKFVFGIAYATAAFLYSLLMQCRTVDKFKEFTEQFKLYADCHKGGLLKECVEVMVRVPSVKVEEVILIKKLIDSIGKLIGAMKRVKSEVVHSAACSRTKHKICRQRVTAGMHHHHRVLGEADAALTHSSPCCVSVLYDNLTSLLVDDDIAQVPALRTKVLRAMLNSGVCCCVSPGHIMENIVRLMLTHCGVASLCFSVLEHTVYGELGASVLVPKITDQQPCAICQPDDIKSPGKYDQKHCSHLSTVKKKNILSFLIHYNSLLQLDNHNSVLHSTVGHLLRVTPKCRMEMKHELLFSVIYPTFIVAKHRYIIRQEESAYFLTASCLNIFASLLNATFAEEFIQKGGLSYVLELVSLPEFSKQCCSILEITIVVEIFKLLRENAGDPSYCREIASLSSVQMLLTSLHDMKDKCLKIYKLKLPEEKFDELCDISKEMTMLGRINTQGSSPVVIRSGSRFEECDQEDVVEDYIEVLKTVWTFWKCCEALCLCNPMFRRYLMGEDLYLDTFKMLKVLFYYLGTSQCTNVEMKIVIKIVEALLTIQFAVSDSSSGQYKETSTELVRDTFLAECTLCSDGVRARALCEMLIRVATTCASAEHVLPPLNEAKLPPMPCASVSSELESSSSEGSVGSPYDAERSDPSHYTGDDGYEADVEISKVDLMLAAIKASSSQLRDVCGNADTLPNDCNEYTESGAVTHPELCVIVIDILTQLIQKLLQEDKHSEITKKQDDSLSAVGVSLARACCARLSAALSRPPACRLVAAPLHLILRLLGGAAAKLLEQRSAQLEELQRSILELVQVLASQSIDSSELAAFLQLFRSEKPPVNVLLSSLARLVDDAQPNRPDCILYFPVDRLHKDMVSSSLSGPSDSASPTTSQSRAADQQARSLHEQHVKSGITSCWSNAAVMCGVEGGVWAAWLQGFAALLWLRLAPPASYVSTERRRQSHATDSSEEYPEENRKREKEKKSPPKKDAQTQPESVQWAHVLSVGHDLLMFEMWIDVNTGGLSVKLSRPDLAGGTDRVLSEARVDIVMSTNQWHCVAFNVKEIVCKKKIHIQVTIFINGRECETVSLPLQGILVHKVMSVNVLLGQSVSGAAGARSGWLLGDAAILRSPILSTYSALYVTARGPNASLLTTCQIEPQLPNYSQLLTSELLNCSIDWNQVYSDPYKLTRELQDSLLLSYSAQTPTIINLYHQTVSNVFASRVSTAASLMATAAATSGAMSTIPETLFVTCNGDPLPSQYKGLPPAAYMLGGVEVFLYLFARVVELDASESEQAVALSLLLKLCRLDNRLYSQFHENDALSMIQAVMATDKCLMSHHFLKVFLDEACSSPVLVASGGKFYIMTRSDAIITEPKFLIFLIRAWKELECNEEPECDKDVSYPPSEWMYERSSSAGLVTSLLVVLHVLLRDEHPARSFNQYQMNRVNLLEHLLLACKDRFSNCNKGALCVTVSTGIVELVRALLPSPPLKEHVSLILNFLLLMHQASDTFVTHSRRNFYFLLTSEPQATSEFNILNFMSKRKSSRRGKKKVLSETLSEPGYLMVEIKTKPTPEISAQSTEKNINISEEQARHTSPEDVLPEGESSIDSTKELKGLINMKIKEKSEFEGKSRSSISTSEHSDNTLEESVPLESAHERRTVGSDYVVIDYDEVGTPKPVRQIAAELQHQEGTGHGDILSISSSWAVAEGLLLLLHDVINMMPDNELTQALSEKLKPEIVVVLGNHSSAGVRAAVVRLLGALQRHSSLPDLYYYHIAHQISLSATSWELAAACALLVTKCDASLEDQIEEDVWSGVRERCVSRSGPLISLLPCSLHDIPLAHNLTLLLLRIVEKASLKMITELAIVEVVIRSLCAVGSMSDTKFEGRNLILGDLGSVLNKIAVKALMSQHNMQNVYEIEHLLSYSELSGRTIPVLWSVMRAAHCSLYHAQLDNLEDSLHTTYTSTTNYFTTVLSSAVSLSSESVGGSLSRSELAGRHRTVVVRAVNFIVTREPENVISSDEVALVERLYSTLLNAVSGSSPLRPKWWVSMGADWLSPLQELFYWLISPDTRSLHLKEEALTRAYHAPPAVQQLLTPTDPSGQRKLSVYLVCVLKAVHSQSSPGVPPPITDWARAWALQTQAQLGERIRPDSLAAEAARLAAHERSRARRSQYTQHIAKVVFSKEPLANKLTDSAMSITRQVVDIQNEERKAFIEHLRCIQSESIENTMKWQKLIDNYTHEQALWYDEKSYPKSWELDPTEGPGRVRVRLRRCHLNIAARFLKDGHKHKIECGHIPPPLSYLRGGASRGPCEARGAPPGRVSFMARVTHVAVDCNTRGDLLLTDTCIQFVPDENMENAVKAESDSDISKTKECCIEHREATPALSWHLDQITSVVTRRWCLQEHAVELFLSTGHAHLVAFNDIADRNAFLEALNYHLPHRSEEETLQEAMNLWRNGAITNWEYLMKLNGLGGRSYNDLMQYPVVPFVLADYSSRILDLRASETFRDLGKPMAIQDKSRESHYIQNYNDLRQARREGSSPLLSRQPHHYASLYSNSGAVLHYLVRMPPYTGLFLSYQDNNFDMPDRTFHSLQTTWRLITRDSSTDVKELIPEFYYLPEFLNNGEGLNLGIRQCGLPVEDVELPPWAPDARLFTLIHRHALESPAVTDALPHWIDLVFGYKQTGQAAIDSINVFPACTYYGFEPESLPDEQLRSAAATMVRTYGQAPRQLLRQPHPHAVVDLQHRAERAQVEIWAGVEGARWGQYCGAPGARTAPRVTLCRRVAGGARVQVLCAARGAAAVTATSLVAPAPTQDHRGGAAGPALCHVTWGHADRGVRLKWRRETPPDLLLRLAPLHQITAAATCCLTASSPLLFGFSSGQVLVLRSGGGSAAHQLRLAGQLRAHSAPVVDICVCTDFAVIVTASQDGRVVIWDLNTLSYVRTLPNRERLPLTCAAVSSTLGDVSTAHPLSGGSLLRAYTLNGVGVGAARVPEMVRCLTYSRAAEGASVNCVAAGLAGGGVRLYSSWDLRPVTYIPPVEPVADIVGITYSADSSVLWAVLVDGRVVCWDGGRQPAPPGRLVTHQHIF